MGVIEASKSERSEYQAFECCKIFSREETGAASEFYSLPSGQLAVYLQKSPGKGADIEDSVGIYCIEGRDCVLAVADGMGGMPCGADASGLIVKHLSLAFSEAGRSESGYRETVLNAIETANRAIVDLGVGAGSTVAIVEINDNSLRPYHAGDSEILVVGQRGQIKLQTISHSPVGYAVEAGLLNQQEAIHHDERHLLSNYLGSPDMRIEIGPALKLARYDTVVVASDGVFDNVHLEELVETVRKGDLRKVAARLVNLVRQRMEGSDPSNPSKPDDVSFILYRRSG